MSNLPALRTVAVGTRLKTLLYCTFFAVLVLLLGQFEGRADMVAGWDFQTTTSGGTALTFTGYFVQTSFSANFGVGKMYLDGTHGSSSWLSTATASNDQLTSTSGTTSNSGTGFSTATASPASLSLTQPANAGTNSCNTNGKQVSFAFSMDGRKTLVISYAYRRSSGQTYTKAVWDFSADGVNWGGTQTISYSVNPEDWSITTLTTSALDSIPAAYARVTVSGASNNPSSARNFQLDNIQFNFNAPAPASVWRSGSCFLSCDTVQTAVNAATLAGDIVRLAPGVVYENITLIQSGTLGNPIVIEGALDGTSVLDGADTGLIVVPNTRWTNLGNGSYDTHVAWNASSQYAERAHVSWVFPDASVNGGTVLAAYHTTTNAAAQYRQAGTIRDGYDATHSDPTHVTIWPGALGDPGSLKLWVPQAEGTILIQNAAYVTVRNLEVRHGGVADIFLRNSHDVTIQEVTCSDAFRGISNEGFSEIDTTTNINILDCRVLNKWNSSWAWDWGYNDSASSSTDWGSPMRGAGIHLSAKDSTVSGNFVQGGWDGMCLEGNNVDIHNNTINNFTDDGVELESRNTTNTRFHSNLLYNIYSGISNVSQSPGPLYIYRNRVSTNRLAHHPDGSASYGQGIKMGNDFDTSTSHPHAEKVYFYHNTIYSKRYDIWDKETTEWFDYRFIANFFVCSGLKDNAGGTETNMICNTGRFSGSDPTFGVYGCVWDGNLFDKLSSGQKLFKKVNGNTNGGSGFSTLTAATTVYPTPTYSFEVHGIQVDATHLEGWTNPLDLTDGACNTFSISSTSAAVGAAQSLPSGWPDDIAPSYDIGAVEHH